MARSREGDRQFESRSLQRGVRCEPGFRGPFAKLRARGAALWLACFEVASPCNRGREISERGLKFILDVDGMITENPSFSGRDLKLCSSCDYLQQAACKAFDLQDSDLAV